MQSSTLHSSFTIVSSDDLGVMSIALRIPDLSDSLLPAPSPILSIVNDAGTSESRTAAANAAPVGVTYSPWDGVILSGNEWAEAMLATAGAGTGITPCWHLMHPVPS